MGGPPLYIKRDDLTAYVRPVDCRLCVPRAAFEAFVLVKDVEWSERLAKFAQHLPALQRELPVDAKYKAESPGSDADLNAYANRNSDSDFNSNRNPATDEYAGARDAGADGNSHRNPTGLAQSRGYRPNYRCHRRRFRRYNFRNSSYPVKLSR